MKRLLLVACVVFCTHLFEGSAASQTFSNDVRIRIPESRQGLCGAKYPGPAWAQVGTISVNGQEIGKFDLADPKECSQVRSTSVSAPADSEILIRVDVPGAKNSMTTKLRTSAGNRTWNVYFFSDSLWGEAVAAETQAAAPPAGTFNNTVRILIPESRKGVCGGNYPGPDWARVGNILVDGQFLAKFDLANPAECEGVRTVSLNAAPDAEIVIQVEVPGAKNTMSATLRTKAENRTWNVYFFSDSLSGEVQQSR